MKKQLVLLSIAAVIVLGGCGNNNSNQEHEATETNHSDMNHSSSSEVPNDIKEADNPAYPVGSQAVIQTDHMEGMKGAKATIVGAYDTTAYAVSYNPTSGGEPVENHKWVIHEEIEDAGNQTLKPNTEVTLEADHMPGMKDAIAIIVSSKDTTVYLIDYTPTTGVEPVKNHKWVTESELSTK